MYFFAEWLDCIRIMIIIHRSRDIYQKKNRIVKKIIEQFYLIQYIILCDSSIIKIKFHIKWVFDFFHDR